MSDYWYNDNYFYDITKINEPIMIDNFITVFECMELLSVLENDPNLKSDYNYDSNGNYFRKCDKLYMCYSSDMSYKWIDDKIHKFFNLEHVFGETSQYIRYNSCSNDKIVEHFDAFFQSDPYLKFEKGGQRTYTCILYLNTLKEGDGGETVFPKLNLKFRPSIGSLLVWNNLLEDGSIDPNKIHYGSQILNGTKHIITKFFREYPINYRFDDRY